MNTPTCIFGLKPERKFDLVIFATKLGRYLGFGGVSLHEVVLQDLRTFTYRKILPLYLVFLQYTHTHIERQRGHNLGHFISCTLEGCTMYYRTYDIILFSIVTMDKEWFVFHFATSSIFVVEKEG